MHVQGFVHDRTEICNDLFYLFSVKARRQANECQRRFNECIGLRIARDSYATATSASLSKHRCLDLFIVPNPGISQRRAAEEAWGHW